MCSDFFPLQACVSMFDARLEGVESSFFSSLVSYRIVVVVVHWLT